MKLRDKVILVTGGGSIASGVGIGKACCMAYAREGAKVIALDLRLAAAQETAELIGRAGGSCLPLEVDVSDADALQAGVQAALDAHGRLDGLHHNVGIGKPGGATDISLDDWRHIQAVNMESLFHLTRQIVPIMQRQGAGVLLATSSIAGMRYLGYPHLAYNVTKAATIHYMKMIALQYAADGIRANTIVPGLIDTPRIAHTVASQFADDLQTAKAARARQVPLGRMGTPWDVAHAAVFLMSDAAAYITGTELVIDGGITAKMT